MKYYTFSMRATSILMGTFRLKNWALVLTFIISLFCNRVSSQISRTTIWSNATSYQTYVWTAGSLNVRANWNGDYCAAISKNIWAASWVNIGINTSMPYSWGGFSTTLDHNISMSGGKSAGNVCSAIGGGCTGGGDLYNACSSGDDCSGFAGHAYGLGTKPSTVTLDGLNASNLTNRYPDPVMVLQGDLFNKSGSHTMVLNYRTAATGNVSVLEASGFEASWRVALNPHTLVDLTGYYPTYFTNLCATTKPTSSWYSTLTSTSVTLWWSNYSKNYNVKIKTAAGATWTTYAVIYPGVTFTGLTPSTNYQFQVQSKCGASTGSWSIIWNFTTLPLRESEDNLILSSNDIAVINYSDPAAPELQYNQINIYPNPVAVGESVNITNAPVGSVIKLIGVDGREYLREIIEGELQPIEIPTDLPSGFYLITILNNDENLIYSTKVFIE